jgi:F-type H+-transporting ATPase subunit b
VELTWSTFIIEIVNFLVLVWLLQHFLYRPVRNIVDRRRESIRQELDDARAQRSAGEALQARYEARFADWEKERAEEHERMQRELDAEREQRREALRKELIDERRKARALAAHDQEVAREALEKRAVDAGARFASHLLQRVADAALEASLMELTVADLAGETGEELRRALCESNVDDEPVDVTTAFEAPSAQRTRIEQALATLAGRTVPCTWHINPRLVAGLRLRAGAVVVDANLAAELDAFAAAAGTEAPDDT